MPSIRPSSAAWATEPTVKSLRTVPIDAERKRSGLCGCAGKDEADMAVAETYYGVTLRAAAPERPPAAPRLRPRVDGKFLARGGCRFRVHGVTYGPFVPNAAGEPFPELDRVRDDF